MTIDIEQYMKQFFKGTKDVNLSAMKYFMKEYNDFQKEMKFIHIAGTNGKGSCTEMISNILVKQGYKVGKFISPHLIKYNERISINGKEISNEYMSKLIEELETKFDKYKEIYKRSITFFELETMMALLYFYRNNVDFAILETGLGGLYDCTNIITDPLISIITSIGYDHMHILGNTLPEIAYQKAGIIKENSNTVIIEQSKEVNKIFEKICLEKKNKLHSISKKEIENYHYDNDFQYFDYKELKQIPINLKGKKQVENASICIESIKILNKLGYEISEENLREGLSTVIHKARMEILSKEPMLIYDGAHNEPAIQNLKESIDMYYKDFKRLYIISILKRKNYEKILSLLMEDEDAIFIVTSGNDEEKYISKEVLYEIALKYRKEKQIIKQNSLEEAIEFAKKNQSDGVTFIVGSFYTYSTVLNKIKNK